MCLLAAVVVHEIISVAVDRHVAGRSRLLLSENHELQRTPKGPTVADGTFTGSKPAGNMVWLSTSRQ